MATRKAEKTGRANLISAGVALENAISVRSNIPTGKFRIVRLSLMSQNPNTVSDVATVAEAREIIEQRMKERAESSDPIYFGLNDKGFFVYGLGVDPGPAYRDTLRA